MNCARVKLEHQLEYEETERKYMSKVTSKKTTTVKRKPATKGKVPSKAKVTLKVRLGSLKKTVLGKFDNIKKKLGIKSKKAKKPTNADKKLARQQKIRGIIGIGLLFVVVSIAYSTYMTVLFVNGTMTVVALIPQVIFATATLLIAFYKIYK
jgi:hypothetical protein